MVIKLFIIYDIYEKSKDFIIFYNQIYYYSQYKYIGKYVRMAIENKYINCAILYLFSYRLYCLMLIIKCFHIVMGLQTINDYYYINENNYYCTNIEGNVLSLKNIKLYGFDKLIMEHFL